MKIKKLRRNTSVILIIVAMVITGFPQFSKKVHAAELPDITQFATKEELKTFNTNDQDGEIKTAKVYFGKNQKGNVQEWWIAGHDDKSPNKDNLVLVAAGPLQENVKFNNNMNNSTYEGQEVYPNHYGASDIRKTLHDMSKDTSYFTKSEQNLMNSTTLYTDDTKNNSAYSTTDKLYLGYGDIISTNDSYITVGTNDIQNLNQGLRVELGYFKNGTYFWLRAPYLLKGESTLVGTPSDTVYKDNVTNLYNNQLPAFELNLSSVLFASTAQAANKDGKLEIVEYANGDSTFTLRYESKDLGGAQIAKDNSKVNLQNVSEDTYLVVQNSDGAWSKKVNGATSISASDMGIDSFANYKVWLEKTQDRITYATEVKGINLDVEKGNVQILLDGEYEITGTSNTNAITVGPNISATITMKDVNIDVSSLEGKAAFEIDKTANVTVILEGSNTLKSGKDKAGLDFSDAEKGSLIIKGTGSLTTEGGENGAGIGGGNDANAINISIENGVITTTGGKNAAGFGGGNSGSGKNIVVNGGKITATGGVNAAGIGGGNSCDVLDIKNSIIINDGEIIAIGGAYAAGIGGGYNSNPDVNKEGNDIVINGGMINVTGGENGAGIGGGEENSNTNIVINGGKITSLGGNGGAGIGGDATGLGVSVIITDGEVMATGGDSGAGIGGGFENYSGIDIKISGGTVTAVGGNEAAGIGDGSASNGLNIVIEGGTVTAIGGEDANCIGKGPRGHEVSIVVTGGSIKTIPKEGNEAFSELPTDGKGNVVYLAKLDQQDNITSVVVNDIDYKIQANHENDSSLYLYLPSDSYVVNANGKLYGARWNGVDGFTWITENRYTLSIPATSNSVDLSDGDKSTNIKVSDVSLVDQRKEIKVKIADSTEMDDQGLILKLGNHRIHSLVSLDNTFINLLNKGSEILSVKDGGVAEKTLYLQKPKYHDGSKIPAGTYNGVLTFRASIE